MNILYEEEGGFKVGAILADNDTSLQVEAPHGKRSKVKASNVLLRFAEPAAGVLLDEAQRLAQETDADFLWEVGAAGEFLFTDLAREYFGHAPNAVEAASILIRLHDSPMHFYKKGKGRYKPAPADALASAKSSVERKRQQALQLATYVDQLARFTLPDAFIPQLSALLYAPDKNTLEFKALEQACQASNLSIPKLLEKCGALPSIQDYHLNAFLFEHFPHGAGFGEVAPCPEPEELPLSRVTAFSIDDASTTEIDDAFSVTRLSNGNWEVGIHIAAPALGIPPGSALDEIAVERLSTVYIPGSKITMLPDTAIERYTLVAGKSCPALSMYLELAPDYALQSSRSIIERVNVNANLRHDTLEPLFNTTSLRLDNTDYPFKQELGVLWALANRLEKLRGKQDDIQQRVDYNFFIDAEHVDIVERPRGSPIDKVVAELMIHVNSQWAKLLMDNNYAAIYRAQNNGKVRMTTAPAKHQGLGVEQYIWVSSPLRRYIDLLNQRQLIALLREQAPPYTARSEDLLGAMRDFELAYDTYNNFQRNMERYWSLRYLQQESISEINATVLKENLVRLDRMPLVTRVISLPELPPGERVLIEVRHVDLLELHADCHFKHKIES